MNTLIIDTSYFKIAAYRNWQEGDNFYNQYNFYNLILQRKFIDVIDLGNNILNTLQGIDKKAYSNIHKGTPFYWMGMASFLNHDFVTANFFFDAAVSEDLINKNKNELIISPSILFASLNDNISEQAAKDLVIATKKRIEEFIQKYNDSFQPKNDLGMEKIRTALLYKSVSKRDHPWRNLSTSMISFFFEWDYRKILLNLRIYEGSNESFFNHLFKGCLLFESLLKENPKNRPERKLNNLSKVLNHLEIKNDLGLSGKKINIGNYTLKKILAELEPTKYKMPKHIEITGRVRNTLGHNLVWNTNINNFEHQALFTSIALSCLHVINILY